MNEIDRKKLAALLREALPLARPELEADLWPRMLRALDREPGLAPGPAHWLDWALLAGAVSWCAVFPAVVSALLYQL
jgi:hypothetical protein